nr:hypothetical protein RVX_1579 [Nitratidesulfovibrio sp. HK-II]
MLRLLEHRNTGNDGDLEAALPAMSQWPPHPARARATMFQENGRCASRRSRRGGNCPFPQSVTPLTKIPHRSGTLQMDTAPWPAYHECAMAARPRRAKEGRSSPCIAFCALPPCWSR